MPLPAILEQNRNCRRQSSIFPLGNPKMFHFWWEGHCPSPTVKLYDKRKFEMVCKKDLPGGQVF
jgi:hypothetical protein